MDQVKRRFIHVWGDRIFLSFVFVFLVVISIERLDSPSFWDETKVYFLPLYSLYDDFVGYFSGPLTLYHRPPAIHFLYLPFIKIFGEGIVLVRLLSIGYLFWGTALFYKVLARTSRFIAILTILFFLLTPIVQVYSVQYAGEFQLFFLYSLIFFLISFYKEKYVLIFLVGVFAGLSRETALSLVPAIALFYYLSGERNYKKISLTSLGPLVGMGIYFAFTYYKTGQFFHHLTIDQGHINLFLPLGARFEKLWETLLVTYRLIPLLALSAILTLFYWRRQRLDSTSAFCLIMSISYIVVFSGHLWCIPRYYLAVFPFLVFFLLRSCLPFLISKTRKFLFLLLVLLPPLLIGNPASRNEVPFYFSTGLQDTWKYLEVLKIHERVISDIKEKVPANSIVMTSWPFIEILKSKHLGYGKFIPYTITTSVTSEQEVPDVILWTDYPRQLSWENIEEILSRAEYLEKDYAFEDYKLKLFIKKQHRDE